MLIVSREGLSDSVGEQHSFQCESVQVGFLSCGKAVKAEHVYYY